jgi:hypothetical protein
MSTTSTITSTSFSTHNPDFVAAIRVMEASDITGWVNVEAHKVIKQFLADAYEADRETLLQGIREAGDGSTDNLVFNAAYPANETFYHEIPMYMHQVTALHGRWRKASAELPPIIDDAALKFYYKWQFANQIWKQFDKDCKRIKEDKRLGRIY